VNVAFIQVCSRRCCKDNEEGAMHDLFDPADVTSGILRWIRELDNSYFFHILR
jgi:hypothetical protein